MPMAVRRRTKRRSDGRPTSLRWRSASAPTSLRRRSASAPTSLRCRSGGRPPARRHRPDVVPMSGRYRAGVGPLCGISLLGTGCAAFPFLATVHRRCVLALSAFAHAQMRATKRTRATPSFSIARQLHALDQFEAF